MKYKGKELKEFTSAKSVVFDPPKKMVVWDNDYDEPKVMSVAAYLSNVSIHVVTAYDRFVHCAELPGVPKHKPRRATNREFAKWIAQGNGEMIFLDPDEPDQDNRYAHIDTNYKVSEEDEPVPEVFLVRKWEDTECHEPTTDYMGLED